MIDYDPDDYDAVFFTDTYNQFRVTRNYQIGTVNLGQNPEHALSIEWHRNGGKADEGHDTIVMSFDDFAEIFRHVLDLYEGHKEAGDIPDA